MSYRCSFVPAHVLDAAALCQACQDLEPSSVQRSAVVSAQFRQARQTPVPAIPGVAVVIGPEVAPEGLTVPQPGTAGRLIYDNLHNWPPTYDSQFI